MTYAARRGAVLVVAAGLAVTACLDAGDPFDTDVPECAIPTIDTSDWVRTEGSVSILLPPEFERVEDRWERGGTRIWLDVVPIGEDPTFLPLPGLIYTGSCRAEINGRRVIFDYGGMNSGGPSPDLGVVATWRSVPIVGGNGDIFLSAQAVDHSDDVVVEAAAWSIIILSGPGGP